MVSWEHIQHLLPLAAILSNKTHQNDVEVASIKNAFWYQYQHTLERICMQLVISIGIQESAGHNWSYRCAVLSASIIQRGLRCSDAQRPHPGSRQGSLMLGSSAWVSWAFSNAKSVSTSSPETKKRSHLRTSGCAYVMYYSCSVQTKSIEGDTCGALVAIALPDNPFQAKFALNDILHLWLVRKRNLFTILSNHRALCFSYWHWLHIYWTSMTCNNQSSIHFLQHRSWPRLYITVGNPPP